jgi:hypothetical protein
MPPKHYLLLAPEPGDSGSTPTALERGDVLPEEADVDPDNPDGELAAEALTAELEAEKEAPKEDPKKDSRIPLSRHEAVLNKEREKRADLERQLAQYQNGQQVATVNEQITAAEDSIMKMERQHAELLTDGEIDKAVALMANIRRAERDMAEAKSDMKIHAAEIRATERAKYNTGLERIEAAYPELNPDSEDYNEELMGEVAELKDAYQTKGYTPTVALQKAVKALVEPRTTKQEMATSVNPRVSEKDVAAERKTAAVGKTAKATAATPPNLNRSGIDSDKIGKGASEATAIMNMSQEAFKKFADANPDALAKMRGDVLE